MTDLAQSAAIRPRPKLRLAVTAAALTCLLAAAGEAPGAGAAVPAAKSQVSPAKRVNLRKRSAHKRHYSPAKATQPATPATPTTPTTPSAPMTPTKPTKPTTPTKPATPTSPTTPTTPTKPTTPTTPTAPTLPGIDTIFSGAKIKDFALIQSAPGAITEVPDPLGSGQTVLKTTVSDKDVAPITPTENPRAQALSPDIIKNGDEFWLQTKFMLPTDFPSNIPGWVGLGSIYGEPFGGPSPWQLDIEGEHICWPRNSHYKWDVPWQMPIVKGQWITVLLHERFAADGWVEMWVNGAPIKFFASGASYNPSKIAPTEHLAMQTMDSSNNGGPNSAKIANYRLKGMFSSMTIYFGGLKVGKTRASVEG
jgi:hypothetical protein